MQPQVAPLSPPVTVGGLRPGVAKVQGSPPRSPANSPGASGRTSGSPPRAALGSLGATGSVGGTQRQNAGGFQGFGIQSQAQSLMEASARLAAATAAAAAVAATNASVSEASEGDEAKKRQDTAAVADAPEAAARPPPPGQESVRGGGLGDPLLGSGPPEERSFVKEVLVPVVLFALGILCVHAGFQLAAMEQEAAEKANATAWRAGRVPNFRWQLAPVLLACLLGLACRLLCRAAGARVGTT